MTTLQEEPEERISTMTEQTALVHVKPDMDDKVNALYLEGVRLKTYADALVIQNSGDIKQATDDLTIIAGLKKAIEELRTEKYTGPLNAHLKAINAAFKEFVGPLDQADTIMRQKVSAYRAEQERIRLEEEEINRLREETARREMKLKGELTEPVGLVEVTPEAPTRYQTDVGTLGTAKIWKWALEDMSLVPEEYKILDAVKIGKVVRAGIPSIPGIRIYEEETLKISARQQEPVAQIARDLNAALKGISENDSVQEEVL